MTGGPVVFVLKGYPRLSETFIAQEILGLERRGLDIRIVALRRPTDRETHPVHAEIRAPVSYLPEYLRDDARRVLRSLSRVWRRRGFWRATGAFLADFARDRTANRIRRFGQALVLAAECPAGATRLHAHFIHTPASATRYAALILGLDWSCSAHAKDIWTTPDRELAGKLASADWSVTCTKAGCDRLAALAPPGKAPRLVYHGLDLARFSPMTGPRSARDGRDADDPVLLLTVGRAVEKKGLDTLIAALAMLPPGLAWRWRHIGGGALAADLRAEAQRRGLSERIEWLGARAQEEVLAAYRAADLFVLPCRVAGDGDRDGLPNVLVEAQSQGLCCLSTDVAGVPELIEPDETGVLVPPEDPVRLAAALETLIGDPARRLALGKAGQRRARAAFAQEAGLDALAALFELPRGASAPHADAIEPRRAAGA